MARPKKEDAGQAVVRIEDAFWDMLDEMPYDRITVHGLSHRAGVNHNTFYYHFENIDDLARQAIEHNAGHEILPVIHESLENGSFESLATFINETKRSNLERTRLLIRNDSPFLYSLAQNQFKQLWLRHLKVDEAELTLEERMELTFISNGLIATMGVFSDDIDIEDIAKIFNRPLYQSAIATLVALKEHRRNDP